tara:strand:- start:951 stop:1502 length:552 start_codon:yes stop_codon:yes gene_type:complete
MDCIKVILIIVGVSLLLLLLLSMCGETQPSYHREAKYPPPLLSQGGGCGCIGDFDKVSGSSFAGKILAKVDTSVHSTKELNAKVNGGSSRKDSFVCLGGNWNHATNMDVYNGLITGGGDVRFSNRDLSSIPTGAHGGVLDQTHPAHAMSLDGFLTAMPGGSLNGKKYFAVKTHDGGNQWYARK